MQRAQKGHDAEIMMTTGFFCCEREKVREQGQNYRGFSMTLSTFSKN
jgi:hypothetical protein